MEIWLEFYSGENPAFAKAFLGLYLKDRRDAAHELDVYLEHHPHETRFWQGAIQRMLILPFGIGDTLDRDEMLEVLRKHGIREVNTIERDLRKTLFGLEQNKAPDFKHSEHIRGINLALAFCAELTTKFSNGDFRAYRRRYFPKDGNKIGWQRELFYPLHTASAGEPLGEVEEGELDGQQPSTTAQQVLSLYYLFNELGLDWNAVNKTDLARFTQFLTGKQMGAKSIRNTSIYKIWKSLFRDDNDSKRKEKWNRQDLELVKAKFQSIGFHALVKKIQGDLDNIE